MASPYELKQRILSLNMRSIAEQAVEDTKQDIVERQQEQLRYGLNRKGQKIGKYKNDAYAKKKNALNPLPGLGNVDLKLEGDFHREIFVEVTPDVFKTDSKDSKSIDLQKKYPDALGLDPDHKKGYANQELRKAFMKHVREKAKL